MPELPEVEVLVRRLRPILVGRHIKDLEVGKPRLLRPTSPSQLQKKLIGTEIIGIERRGKFIRLSFQGTTRAAPIEVMAHLGMTGRMFVVETQPKEEPKHVVVKAKLDHGIYYFTDPRGFGRFTLETSSLSRLGLEPLSDEFTGTKLKERLGSSKQPVKVRIMDQAIVVGVGNIYASESLHRARIKPSRRSSTIKESEAARLCSTIRETLREAIDLGMKVDLDLAGTGNPDGLFYYGETEGSAAVEERFQVYDRAGEPCRRCGGTIRKSVHAGRSTFYCPGCQK